MSLNKAILYGKEHRKQYRGGKAIDKTCRNHGGDPAMENNLFRKRLKIERDITKAQIEDLSEELFIKYLNVYKILGK